MRLLVTNKLGMFFDLESICDDTNKTKIVLRRPYEAEHLKIIVPLPLQKVYEKWKAWDNGLNIANAFPELNENEMEFIMTGWTDRN